MSIIINHLIHGDEKEAFRETVKEAEGASICEYSKLKGHQDLYSRGVIFNNEQQAEQFCQEWKQKRGR